MLLKLGLIAVLASLLAVSQGQYTPEPIPSNLTTSKKTTTSTPPTTTTPASTTTISTVAPTTVTPNSTSTSTTPQTTSAAPSTSTAAPTTTLAPPTAGKWTVKDSDTNLTCIMADMAIQVDVTLDVNKTLHDVFDVPSNASSVGSHCGNKTQSLRLAWGPEDKSSLTMHFVRNGSNFILSKIVLNTTINSTEMVAFENDVGEFPTPISKSYHCAKEQEIMLTNSENKTAAAAVLKISKVQWEAFHEKNDENFSAAEDCAESTSPDIVPIAVGCALVGLVAIVLIAYLVGRRRSQARGYLSM